MARISWTSQALNDLQATGDFISRDAPAFAQVFTDKVFDSVERLENFPRSGRIVPEINQENIREIIVGSYRVFLRCGAFTMIQCTHLQYCCRYTNDSNNYLTKVKFIP